MSTENALTDKQREYIERTLTMLLLDTFKGSNEEAVMLLTHAAPHVNSKTPLSIDGDVRFCNETDLRIDMRVSIPRELWIAARDGIAKEMDGEGSA